MIIILETKTKHVVNRFNLHCDRGGNSTPPPPKKTFFNINCNLCDTGF